MIEVAIFIASFAGGSLGWLIISNHRTIGLMQVQARMHASMHRRLIEDLKAEVLELRGELS